MGAVLGSLTSNGEEGCKDEADTNLPFFFQLPFLVLAEHCGHLKAVGAHGESIRSPASKHQVYGQSLTTCSGNGTSPEIHKQEIFGLLQQRVFIK